MIIMDEKLILLKKILESRYCNKAKKILNEYLKDNNKEIVELIFSEISSDLIEDGLILKYATQTYFRLKRLSLSDVIPLFDIDSQIPNVNESLLEVLGYDKMIPTIEDQKKIIEKYFFYGDDMDLKYSSDPRYGLAAACAGWDKDLVRDFLEYCLTKDDAPLKYVAGNSLKRKYVKLR